MMKLFSQKPIGNARNSLKAEIKDGPLLLWTTLISLRKREFGFSKVRTNLLLEKQDPCPKRQNYYGNSLLEREKAWNTNHLGESGAVMRKVRWKNDQRIR